MKELKEILEAEKTLQANTEDELKLLEASKSEKQLVVIKEEEARKIEESYRKDQQDRCSSRKVRLSDLVRERDTMASKRDSLQMQVDSQTETVSAAKSNLRSTRAFYDALRSDPTGSDIFGNAHPNSQHDEGEGCRNTESRSASHRTTGGYHKSGKRHR